MAPGGSILKEESNPAHPPQKEHSPSAALRGGNDGSEIYKNWSRNNLVYFSSAKVSSCNLFILYCGIYSFITSSLHLVVDVTSSSSSSCFLFPSSCSIPLFSSLAQPLNMKMIMIKFRCRQQSPSLSLSVAVPTPLTHSAYPSYQCVSQPTPTPPTCSARPHRHCYSLTRTSFYPAQTPPRSLPEPSVWFQVLLLTAPLIISSVQPKDKNIEREYSSFLYISLQMSGNQSFLNRLFGFNDTEIKQEL